MYKKLLGKQDGEINFVYEKTLWSVFPGLSTKVSLQTNLSCQVFKSIIKNIKYFTEFSKIGFYLT